MPKKARSMPKGGSEEARRTQKEVEWMQEARRRSEGSHCSIRT